ncbi:MAG: glycoside hydrolase family 13 protein, partial [Eubacteriales bacterium]|nr:glycoside hydrolase family 13 protein [Eubacteriales bacterium]
MQLYHNSRDYNCRSSVGAQVCSSELSVRLFASDNSLSVTLRTWYGQEKKYNMEHIGAGCYEASIKLPDEPCIFWYDFCIATPDGKVIYYGNAHDGLGGEGITYDHQPPSFQITVYDKDFSPPKFLRDGVMYQIFPDRFYRTQKPKSDR